MGWANRTEVAPLLKCSNECMGLHGEPYIANVHDGMCDDGGAGSEYASCPYGDDCWDCGPRHFYPPSPPPAPPPRAPPPVPPPPAPPLPTPPPPPTSPSPSPPPPYPPPSPYQPSDCFGQCGAGPCPTFCGDGHACCRNRYPMQGCPASSCEGFHCCVPSVPFPPSPPPPPPYSCDCGWTLDFACPGAAPSSTPVAAVDGSPCFVFCCPMPPPPPPPPSPPPPPLRCWDDCGVTGPCKWCGAGQACCRYGWTAGGCPPDSCEGFHCCVESVSEQERAARGIGGLSGPVVAGGGLVAVGLGAVLVYRLRGAAAPPVGGLL